MGDYNQIDGVCEVPTAAGVLRLHGRVTFRVKAAYEDWLEGRARRRVFELRQEGQLDPKEFEASLASVTSACAAGTLSWGGDAWASSLQQLPGIVKLVCLLAAEVPPGARTDCDEEQVLDAMQDEASAAVLVGAVQEILRATPNFIAPPVRGKEPGWNQNDSGPSSGMRRRGS